MGCCTNLAHFFSRSASLTARRNSRVVLHAPGPPRGASSRPIRWPAPFHLGRALLAPHYLTAGREVRIASGVRLRSSRVPTTTRRSSDWLRRASADAADHRSLLGRGAGQRSERDDRTGSDCKYARKVFVDGFLGHRDGLRRRLADGAAGALYGDELRGWLHGAGSVESPRERRGAEAGSAKPADAPGAFATARLLAPTGTSSRCRSSASATCCRQNSLSAEPYFANIRNLHAVADHQHPPLVRPPGDEAARTP